MSKNLLVQHLRTLADAIERYELPIDDYAVVESMNTDVVEVRVSETSFRRMFSGIQLSCIQDGNSFIKVESVEPQSGILFKSSFWRRAELPELVTV